LAKKANLMKLQKTKKPFQEDESENVVASKVDGIENLLETNDLIQQDTTWEQLCVAEKIREGLLEMKFIKPSKIQASAFPLIMKKPYQHLIAQAPNGTGKTGAFSIPTLSRIDENESTIQAVILAHTRELVKQIQQRISQMASKTKIKVTSLLNTDKNPECGHIVVTNPSTFEFNFLRKKNFDLKHLRVLVIDEVDEILNNELTKKISCDTFKYFLDHKLQVQVLFFSATLKPDTQSIIKKYYKKAFSIEVQKDALTLKRVRQMYVVVNSKEEKENFVVEYLKSSIENERVIIFINSRENVINLQSNLVKRGYKVFLLMGGDMDRDERDETVKRFKNGEIQILITTNLLSRGFDEKLVKLVINYEMPIKYENNKARGVDLECYLHRIGRTGRFNTKGIGLSLVLGREVEWVEEIEKFYSCKMDKITSLDEMMAEFKKIIAENI